VTVLTAGPRSRLQTWLHGDGADVVGSWLTARVLVVGALGLAASIASKVNEISPGTHLKRVGLLGWDAHFYSDIARVGYGGVSPETRRFFPLLPALTWLFGFGHATGVILLVLVNVLAFGYGVALIRLARFEGMSQDAARKAVWLLALAPPAFVMVMGYTEALAGLLAVITFYGLRSGRWWLAAVAGLLSGLSRPPGVFLVAPALIEVWRSRHVAQAWLPRISAVIAPAVGAIAYLAYTLIHRAISGAGNHQLGTTLHLPWLLLFLLLLIPMARRMPASYTVWSALALLSTFAGSNLASVERYCWSAFPFVLVAASMLGSRAVWRGVFAASSALLIVYASFAFLQFFVP
jgi:Gpi18-like mannosyltransferase